MHCIYLIHEFHNLSWITEINKLFHDILIYWDVPVYHTSFKSLSSTTTTNYIEGNIVLIEKMASTYHWSALMNTSIELTYTNKQKNALYDILMYVT